MKYTVEVSGRFSCSVITSGSNEQEATQKAREYLCSGGITEFQGDVFISEDDLSAHAYEYQKSDDWEAGSCWDEDDEEDSDE
jgi:hypothetical protein